MPLEDECKSPVLTLFSRKDGDKEDEFAYEKRFNETNLVTVPNPPSNTYEFLYSTKENILKDLDILSDKECDYLDDEELRSLWDSYTEDGEQPEKSISDEEFKKLSQEIFDILKTYAESQSEAQENYNQNRYSTYKSALDNWNNFFEEINETNIFKEFENSKNFKKVNWRELLDNSYAENYGYNFMPKIYVYKENEISNADLETDYDSIEESSFFTALLNSIDVDVSEIQKAHKDFSTKRNMGILQRLTRKLNEKLETVSAKFNKLYYLENAPYSFAIDLQESSIFFYLNRGDNTIFLGRL